MVTLAHHRGSACYVLRAPTHGVTSVYSIDPTDTARLALSIK